MADASTFSFAALSRAPDVEAPNLFAYDATDELLLSTAAPALEHIPDGAVIIGDRYGALTLGAAARSGCRSLRVHQDALSGELALQRNAARLGLDGRYTHHGLDQALLAGARIVLLQLPRGLEALDEIAWTIARHAAPDVRLFAGGRVKHMVPAMNQVLGRYFSDVSAGLAERKSRILAASQTRRVGPSPFPVEEAHDVGLRRPLVLGARGAAYGGTKLDPGTRLLLAHLDGARQAAHAVDLGCGTGAIAAYLALSRPGLTVTASDQSWAAVRSAETTAQTNGVADRMQVVRDDALAAQPPSSVELVALNPPFHIGASVHTGIAHKLFTAAARVLAPGGELWTVWNSHLQYRPALERLVGPTRQIARNPKFTVTVSVKR
jgi:16S rRNA (guanine1207-N2)-methyltransferase